MRPARIRDNEMENYDLSTITRDNLLFLLRTAKDEIVKYSYCRTEAKRCKERFEEEKKIIGDSNNAKNGCLGFIIISVIICAVGALYSLINGNNDSLITVGSIFFLFVIAALFITPIVLTKQKRIRKIAQSKAEECKVQYADLKKKAEEAMNGFKAALFIPDDYSYEYALATMLKYIDNKRADNWKEVTGLYEEHLHRMTMEDNARQTLEQSKLQAEYAREGRNAARWAAAGAWATAAGIWRK